jgi:2-amino-4-hydroxy-6-hydroxymethyldihydropteridine diphosphokinase
MNEFHLAYLNLGSNIQPETNLFKAVQLLSGYGEVQKISNVWESEAMGADGPNYLNVCILFKSAFGQSAFKAQVIRPIEEILGRKRNDNKYASRPIDIDIVLFDDRPVIDNFWEVAYVIVPLAELYAEYQNPESGEKVSEIATRLRRAVWLETRWGVLK